MCKRLFVLFVPVLVVFACAVQSMAQDYRRFEMFAGYSHNRVDVGPVEDFDPSDDIEFDDIFDEREGFNGFNASFVGNFHRYWGAKFDYSYHQKSFEFGPDTPKSACANGLNVGSSQSPFKIHDKLFTRNCLIVVGYPHFD